MSNTQIDSLSIEIKSSARSASKAIDALVASLQKLDSVKGVEKNLQKISESLEKCGFGFKDAANGAKSFTDAASKVASGSAKMGGSLKNVTSNLKSFLAGVVGINSVSNLLSTAINEAKDWSGISARFGEGFGAQADEAYAHVQKLSEALQINDQAFMKYAGNFATLAKGFGVTGKNIAAMSTGLTELGYDIYAKSNDFYSFEEAMNAVRSAVVGEVEPIRKAGISITEAMLKETAAANGITQSVESMSEAQKAQLRYKAMVDQAFASSTVGTYAQEINTAEGMLRSFTQQIKGLVQSLGGLLIPAISSVLPYIQAFVDILTDGIHALAAFFGFSIKGVSWDSGVNDATGAVGGLDDALTSAGGSAKKLKGLLAGFDELNIIQSKNGGGGGGGSNSNFGGDLGLELESLWSDSMLANVKTKVNEIVESIKPHLDDILQVVTAIGAGFLAWKIASGFTSAVSSVKKWFSGTSIPVDIAISVASAAITFMEGAEFSRTGEMTLEDFVQTGIGVLAAGLEGFKYGGVKGAAIAVGISLSIFAAGFVFDKLRSIKEAVVNSKFGSVALERNQIKEFVNGLFGEFDIDATVGIARVRLENLNKAKETLDEAILGVSSELKGIKLGMDNSEEALNSLKGEVENMLSGVNSFLKESDNLLKAMVTISPSLDPNGNLLSTTSEASMLLSNACNSLGKELSSWIDKGMKDGMNEKEAEMIQFLSGRLVRITNAIATGEAKGAFLAEVGKLTLEDLDKNSFEETFASVEEKMKEAKASFTQMQKDALKAKYGELAGLYEVYAQQLEDGLTDAANETASKIANLNVLLRGWDVEANVNTMLNDTTAPVKALYEQWIQNTFGAAFKNVDTRDFLSKLMPNVISSDGTAEGLAEAFNQTMREFVDDLTNGDPHLVSVQNLFGISDWELFGKDAQLSFISTMVETVGAKDTLNAMKQLGYEVTLPMINQMLDMFDAETRTDLLNACKNFGFLLGSTVGSNFGSSMASKANAALKALQGSLNSSLTQINTSTPGKKVQFNMVSLNEFASGGFPTEGQLFIAREAGAELVGSMNGRTAVANNDQIVAGIAGGVAAGQEEQNALLRQQNSILMQLLNKNFTATVAPSAALGRVNAQSAAMYSKMTGV